MTSALTFSQARPFIEATLIANQTPALMGEPGIGKSSLIEGLARTFKTKVFTLPVNQLGDRSDLTGVRLVQDEKTGNWKQKAFPHSTIMDSIEYALANPDEHPMLFMDEFNRATQDITSSILSFQTLRSIGDIAFPDNLRLIVAGNDKGNVTSIDQASISRFAVYRVRPDLDTFMSIQTLNPFVTDVLTKHPEDLMALKHVRNSVVTDDSADTADDENEGFEMADFDFMSDDAFAQITCPRTISYVSDWLNIMGLDKSGSDKERELLGSMFTDMTESDEDNVLLAALEAHVGETTFASHLFDEIQAHFNSMLSATHVSSQPILNNLRPKQDVINKLSRTTTVQDVEALVTSMTEKERLTTLIWLTEAASTKEVNNNQAVASYMTNAPHQIAEFDNATIQNLMLVLPHTDRRATAAVKAMLDSSAPVIAKWKPMIQSIVDQD